MENTGKPLFLKEKKIFNADGKLETWYYVWFGSDVVKATQSLTLAEQVYESVFKENEQPSEKILKHTTIKTQ